MKKLFIFGIILFFCLFFVGCSGSGVTTPSTVPDDGGMGLYDPQFISLLNELYNPLQLPGWLKDNIQYKAHDGRYTPYEFYLKKEGDCGDCACFNCYVLHYHDYVVYFVYIAFLHEPGETEGHFIAVFEHKTTDQYPGYTLDKCGYLSPYRLVLSNTPGYGYPILDSIKDCVDDYMERWGEVYNFDYYDVYPWNFFNYRE